MTSDLNDAPVYLLQNNSRQNYAALREAPSSIVPSICGVQLHLPMQGRLHPGSSVEIGAPLSM